MMKAFLRTLALALVLFGPVALAPAQRQLRDDLLRPGGTILPAFRDAVAAPSKSVVRVQVDGKDVSLGTVISADGYILAHRTDLGDKITCKLRDGKSLDATVAGVDEAHWLTMLKVDAKDLAPIEWKSSKKAEVGDWVASPGTGENPLAVGVVGVAARKLPGVRPVPSVKPGTGGYLGIGLTEDEDMAKIDLVQEGGAASKGGLKRGDVILSIDGQTIDSPEALKSTLGKKKPGDTVTIKLKRDDEEKSLKVTLGRWPRNFGGGFDMNALGSELSDRRNGFPNVLQHDGVVKPVDCGGPLVDLDGKAVGINVSRAGRTETYAIPSEAVLALLDDLKSGKLAPKKDK
jgi:serine protease Do